MNEIAMWKALAPGLRHAGLDPIRIENAVQSGTPDVEYIGGWLELKFAQKWPSRGGPLKLAHYTPQQNAWLLRRHAAGGRAFIVLKVARSWYVLPAGEATYDFFSNGLLESVADLKYRVESAGDVVRRILV